MPEILNELIERQVEEAVDYLKASVRSRHSGDLNSSVLFCEEACERLLQVVQNQQHQIKTQDEILRTLQADVCDLIEVKVECEAKIEALDRTLRNRLSEVV